MTNAETCLRLVNFHYFHQLGHQSSLKPWQHQSKHVTLHLSQRGVFSFILLHFKMPLAIHFTGIWWSKIEQKKGPPWSAKQGIWKCVWKHAKHVYLQLRGYAHEQPEKHPTALNYKASNRWSMSRCYADSLCKCWIDSVWGWSLRWATWGQFIIDETEAGAEREGGRATTTLRAR